MDKIFYTLLVYSENFAGLLNQITAVFTRRQLNIESLNVSASSIPGIHKYTITTWSDRETIEKVVKQIERKIDVIQAHYFTDDEIFLHEIALYKLSTPEVQENPEVSKIVRRHSAIFVEVNTTYCIVEKAGMTEEIISLYNELQKTGCMLQYVRSGRIAITKSCVERVNGFLEAREARYRQERAGAAKKAQ